MLCTILTVWASTTSSGHRYWFCCVAIQLFKRFWLHPAMRATTNMLPFRLDLPVSVLCRQRSGKRPQTKYKWRKTFKISGTEGFI